MPNHPPATTTTTTTTTGDAKPSSASLVIVIGSMGSGKTTVINIIKEEYPTAFDFNRDLANNKLPVEKMYENLRIKGTNVLSKSRGIPCAVFLQGNWGKGHRYDTILKELAADREYNFKVFILRCMVIDAEVQLDRYKKRSRDKRLSELKDVPRLKQYLNEKGEYETEPPEGTLDLAFADHIVIRRDEEEKVIKSLVNDVPVTSYTLCTDVEENKLHEDIREVMKMINPGMQARSSIRDVFVPEPFKCTVGRNLLSKVSHQLPQKYAVPGMQPLYSAVKDENHFPATLLTRRKSDGSMPESRSSESLNDLGMSSPLGRSSSSQTARSICQSPLTQEESRALNVIRSIAPSPAVSRTTSPRCSDELAPAVMLPSKRVKITTAHARPRQNN